jgi:hypothetical protein
MSAPSRLARLARRCIGAASLGLLTVQVSAQTPAAPVAPMRFALVSAVGDQITYVRQRMQTGTQFEGYRRATLKIDDRAVDAAVLRGLDRVIARRHPDSERVFLRLSSGQLDGVLPERRERVALERLREELGKLPQRAQWDQIIVLTPHYRLSEMRGLASKLHGVGVYVQGMDTNVGDFGNAVTGGELSVEGPQTRLPDGKPGQRSSKYIALYAYTQIWVLDAKTLAVIKNEPWLFDEKIYDPQSAALDVAKMLSPEQLAERFEAFAERAAGRALAQTMPMVEAGELRQVDPARAKP